jgi:hypothetical protein
MFRTAPASQIVRTNLDLKNCPPANLNHMPAREGAVAVNVAFRKQFRNAWSFYFMSKANVNTKPVVPAPPIKLGPKVIARPSGQVRAMRDGMKAVGQ